MVAPSTPHRFAPTIAPRLHSRRRDPVYFRPDFVALSRGAWAALSLADASLRILLARHTRGDWGYLSDDDARDNHWALTHAAPVRSLYELATGARLLLETDGTRRVTSILLDGLDHLAPHHAPEFSVIPVGAVLSGAPSPVAFGCARVREVPSTLPPIHHPPACLADILPAAALAGIVPAATRQHCRHLASHVCPPISVSSLPNPSWTIHFPTSPAGSRPPIPGCTRPRIHPGSASARP